MTFIFSARIEAAASQAAVPLLAFGGATGTGGSVTPPAGGSGGSCSSTFLGQSELYVTTNANWSPSGGADITYQQCPQTSGGAGTLTLTSAGGGTPTGLAQSTWAQIALVYSGNVAQGASAALTIFVNGVQVATTTTAVFPPTSIPTPNYQVLWGAVGKSTLYGTTLTGALADVQIANKARHHSNAFRVCSTAHRAQRALSAKPACTRAQALTAAQLANLWAGGPLCGPVPTPVPYAWTVGAAGATCDATCAAANSQICYPPAASATWSGWPQVADGTLISAAAQAGVTCASSSTSSGARAIGDCSAVGLVGLIVRHRVAQFRATRWSPPRMFAWPAAAAPARPRPRTRPPSACARVRRLARPLRLRRLQRPSRTR